MADDYKDAYLREKELRKLAEQKLEDKSRELYESFEALKAANSSMQENQKAMVHNEKWRLWGCCPQGSRTRLITPLALFTVTSARWRKGCQISIPSSLRWISW